MGNWSDIPKDLLTIVATKITLIEDFVTFRAICSTWRSAASKEKFTGTSQLLCLLHLPKLITLPKAVVFHHLRHRPPPSASTPHDPDPPTLHKERFFASKGWLFAINRHGETSLFHPFSRALISLPHVRTLRYCVIQRQSEILDLITEAVLSSSPKSSPNSNNYALIVNYKGRNKWRSCNGLAFWKPGKHTFTEIINHHYNNPKIHWWISITCSNDQLYAMDASGVIVIWDMKISSNNSNDDVPVVQFVIESPLDYELLRIPQNFMFLVESHGEVFIVGKARNNDVFLVHRIDVINKMFEEVKHLGNRALFYGLQSNTCFFMEPSEIPGCIPNRIYMDCTGISYFEFLSDNGVHRARPGIFTFPNGPLLVLYEAPAPLD